MCLFSNANAMWVKLEYELIHAIKELKTFMIYIVYFKRTHADCLWIASIDIFPFLSISGEQMWGMLANVWGMKRLAFRSEFPSPVAKNKTRAKIERKLLNAICFIPCVTRRFFQSWFENVIVIS